MFWLNIVAWVCSIYLKTVVFKFSWLFLCMWYAKFGQYYHSRWFYGDSATILDIRSHEMGKNSSEDRQISSRASVSICKTNPGHFLQLICLKWNEDKKSLVCHSLLLKCFLVPCSVYHYFDWLRLLWFVGFCAMSTIGCWRNLVY